MSLSKRQFGAAYTAMPGRPSGRSKRIGRNPSRRGMTILEVTLAMALLGFVVMAMFSAFGFAGAMSKREQQRLGAAELSSALIVQYLDDKNSLPSQQPIDYGAWKFRYHLREDRVGFIEARPPPGTTRTVSLDRLKQVTITVWLSEESGGSFDPDGESPQVVLTRVVDPMALRNPDSFANMMSSDAGRRTLTDQIGGSGGGGGGGPRTPGGSRGNSAQPPRTPKAPSANKAVGLPRLGDSK